MLSFLVGEPWVLTERIVSRLGLLTKFLQTPQYVGGLSDSCSVSLETYHGLVFFQRMLRMN